MLGPKPGSPGRPREQGASARAVWLEPAWGHGDGVEQPPQVRLGPRPGVEL